MGTDFKILFALATVIAFPFAISPTIRSEREKIDMIRLNVDALDYAKKLIADRHVVVDNHGAWRGDKASTEKENEFIRVHGIDEYAKWHLGIDERHAQDSKARYKFPYGDFKNVHRCALLAVRSRAAQYKYADIEKAAAELQHAVEVHEPSPQSSP